ncbi:FG-GAP-like repeat-containing protein [Spongiimicrobium sp. 3-5]|uniref:FG-GAP-like repeat-containing protein n=1 Tax=Spongiimicrobium sp. 3-5 TaxID=3332596 RepID=UPI003980E3E6
MKRLILLSLNLTFTIALSAQIGFDENVIIKNNKFSLYQPTGIESVDIDGDGDLDVLFSTSSVGWFENIGGELQFSSKYEISDDSINPENVHASDIDGDGDQDVIVVTEGRYGDILWFENLDGQGNFGTLKKIAGVSRAKEIYTADLDGDGDLDVLCASWSGDYLNWYENLDGNGNFGFPINIDNTGGSINSVRAADIDGDGDMDVLSASESADYIAWHENIDGNAQFAAPQIISSDVDRPLQVRFADLDGDMDMDVISTSRSDSKVAWYENTDGNGLFGPQEILKVDPGNGAYAVMPVDLDDDGDLDIISSSIAEIVWQENLDGNGTFSTQKLISSNSWSSKFLHAADFDQDGDIDILSASTHDMRIAWQQNIDGLGTFGSPRTLAIEEFKAFDVQAVDVDGDGLKDIVAATDKSSIWDGTIYWQKQLSNQKGFSPPIVVSQGLVRLKTVSVADIDGDGDMDIVTSSKDQRHIAWYENIDGLGNYGNEIVSQGYADEISSVHPVDIDGDGDIDIAYSSEVRDEIAWFENTDGNGTFGQTNDIDSSSAADGAKNVYSADFDGDGDMDLVCAMSQRDYINWYNNTDGLGTFSRELLVNSSAARIDGVSSAQAADIDGDGDMDIIGAGGKIVWSENTDGAGNFTLPITITENFNGGATMVYPFDADNDGDIDIVGASKFGNEIAWLENTDGQGSFSEPQTIATSSNSQFYIWAIDVADMDNDGNTDILSASHVVLSSFETKISWYRNLGKLGNSITGSVRLDLDANGCTTTDLAFPGIMVVANNGISDFATFTKEDGSYSLPTNQGDFEIKLSGDLPSYYGTSPTTHSTNFVSDNNSFTADFCLSENNTVNDVNITLLPKSEARPGFDASYQIVYTNVGSTRLNGTVVLNYDDSKLNFLSSSQTTSNQSGNTLTFDYAGLNPMETRTIDLVFNVYAPPIVNINEISHFEATINPVNGDNTSDDNSFTLNQIIIGSYDPNDISVLEGSIVEIDDAKNYLHYLIRFQNTGTADAINVKVNTVLNENLDWSTLKIVETSHDNEVQLINGNELRFTFENIHLPSEGQDEPNSHGYISYKIKPKNDISIGDQIKAKAAIYFDFNLPIITNEVVTEIVEETVLTLTTDTTDITCSGTNDGTIQITVEGGIAPFSYAIYDGSNNVLISNGTDNVFENLPAGSYYVNATDANSNQVQSALIDILEPIGLVLQANITAIGCKDGAIEVLVTGGTPPYQYQINGNGYGDSNLFENLPPANYTVDVRDANGCSSLLAVDIIEPAIEFEILSINLNEATCYGIQDGSIEVNATGGVPPYQYQINDGALVSTNLFENLTSGQHTVKAYDAVGCEISSLVTLNGLIQVSISSITVESASCPNANDASMHINVLGGTLPYEYSLDDVNYFSSNVFNNLGIGIYDVFVRDNNGCLQIEQVLIESAIGPDFDNDGIIDTCDEDIDGDDVLNTDDPCPETPLRSTVDSTGCEIFTLPVTNFSVQTVGESCAESNNGSIFITAVENLNYTATLSSNGNIIDNQSFQESLTFPHLEAADYMLCITVANEPDFEKCFSLQITEPEPLFVDSNVDPSGKAVTLKLKGGNSYVIALNGEVQNTSQSEITLPLNSKSNVLSVKTDKDCQGAYEESILLGNNVSVYPNPLSNGEFTISLTESTMENTILTLYSSDGRQLLQKSYDSRQLHLKLDVSNIPSGVYILKIRKGTTINSQKVIIK